MHNFPRQKSKRIKWKLIVLVFILLLFTINGYLNFRPIELKPTLANINIASLQSPNIIWPAYGQASIGSLDQGVLSSTKNQQPVPIASIAKVMTALTILNKLPLAKGESGPVLALTQKDVSYHDKYLAMNGSVLKVSAGQQISEYDALQAMLIASANNIADSLVVWAFGSTDDYVERANNYAKEIGLKSSYFNDATGFSDKTVSTADDLILLGRLALKNEVISEIVSKEETQLPNFGRVISTNHYLNYTTNKIIGIKTGNTDEAGATFLTASENIINGQPIIFIVAVLGAKTPTIVQQDSVNLLEIAKNTMLFKTVVQKGDVVGTYNYKGDSVKAVASKDIKMLIWPGQKVDVQIDLLAKNLPLGSNAKMGAIKASCGKDSAEIDAISTTHLARPKWYVFWKLI